MEQNGTSHSFNFCKPGRPPPELVIANARVITLNDRQPAAELVAINGGRIAWVGSNSDLPGLAQRGVKVIDCQGQTLLPGFIDAHCHLMAYASSLLAVDCGPRAVTSIEDIVRALRERARRTPPGLWIRAAGYDESALSEARHPCRRDLDEAAPGHPVRLDHRSGHACVLNSMALDRVGISAGTPDPEGGVIDRDWSTGEPTGLLLEMSDYLSGRIPPLSQEELRQGVRLASQRLASLGVTSVQDATHSNAVERWDAFGRLKDEGVFAPRITMMVGYERLDEFLERGLRFGSGDANLSLGAVKLMLTMTTGALWPPAEELRRIVLRARASGFQVAIHAVEAEAVAAAAEALAQAGGRGVRDRIEHSSECPPHALDRLRASRAVVVTQPAFVFYSGRRYLSEVSEEMQPWLYRLRSLLDAGLTLAASSDAPIAEPNPLVGIYAAVTRRADTGEVVGELEGVSVSDALRMHTLGGAYAAFQESDRGSIEVGKLADLVLLDRDPTRVEADELRHVKATMTIIGGQVAWQAS
jgi:predicted amidohydrolase YtcJ